MKKVNEGAEPVKESTAGAVAVDKSGKRIRSFSLERRRSILGYVFVLPFIIGFLIFYTYPLVKNLQMSFGKIVDMVGLKTEWIGWDNYAHIFNVNIDFNPAFLDSIQQTFLWTPFILVIALFLAILLNQNIKGKGFFRVIFFLPVLLGSGFVMQQISGDSSSAVSTLLTLPEGLNYAIRNLLNVQAANFISSLLIQITNMFWKTGVQIVIFLAALQGIPDSYYEAARVDSANTWDCFWKITLPMISPTILLNAVYTIIESFRSTDNKIAGLIVNVMYNEADFEYGAAMGYLYFVVVLILVGFIFLFSRKVVHYEK